MKIIFIFLLFFFLFGCSSIKKITPEWDRVQVNERMANYRELTIKNYDQMQQRVLQLRDKGLKSADENNDIETEDTKTTVLLEPLYKALRLIFSRPDRDDNMVSKLVPYIRSELTHINQYQSVLENLTKEAVAGIQHKEIPVVRQATYYFILENLIQEMKPDIERKAKIKSLFEYIRDAHIKLDNTIHSELLLNTMFTPLSPSKMAEEIIKNPKIQKVNP